MDIQRQRPMSYSRIGRFTASSFGKLMAEAQSIPASIIEQYAHLVPDEIGTKVLKSGKRKGEAVRVENYNALLRKAMSEQGIILFGDTARALIASKAGEKRTQIEEHHVDTRSTDRGTLLEHIARMLISEQWTEIEGAEPMGYGDDCGASPDGLVFKGSEVVDLKCPEAFGDVLLFDELPDGDFDALLSWNRDYAWQIMVQAKVFEVKYANLVYFTDRLPLLPIDEVKRIEVQSIIDFVAYRLGEKTNRPWDYKYESNGFYYARKRYELTEERIATIDRVLKAAVRERDAMMARLPQHVPA